MSNFEVATTVEETCGKAELLQTLLSTIISYVDDEVKTKNDMIALAYNRRTVENLMHIALDYNHSIKSTLDDLIDKIAV